MKRVFIACVVLCVCLGLSIFAYCTITGDCLRLKAQAKRIAALTQETQIDRQKQLLNEEWKKDTLAFSLLTTHVHYDALEEKMDRVLRACEKKKKEEIQKTCDDLIFELDHIITSIVPKAENVF